jgi:hypothetical protein
MALPTIRLYVGIDRDVTLEGPGVATLDLDNYTYTRLVCTALGISKSTSSAAAAELQNSGADLKVHFLAADTSSKSPGIYDYVLQVNSATKWFDVGDYGVLELLPNA